MTGMWGNAPDQLFLTLVDPSRSGTDTCGTAYAAWFDGTAFHRM
jgi:hypothetical protein